MSEDKTTVLENSADEDEYDDDYRGPGRWIAIAAVVAVVLGVAGYFAGHASAGSGPSTLAEAVQQAQDGKLACGDTGSAPAAGQDDGAQAGGAAAGGPPGGANGGAFFLRAICDRGGQGAGNAGGANGGGTGFRRGGFGGQAGQVQSLSGDTLVLQDRQGQTVKVKLTSSTTVRKSDTGSLSDVKPGATVTVTGNPATSITILPASQ
jgi:hypothetical protein